MAEILRIANCSGFMGDRFTAAREMVDGGPIDVLTGDYLAELTMGILQAATVNNPDGGYADSFLYQAQDILEDCLNKNIKIVVNAGGLNPAGLVKALEEFAQSKGLNAKIAYIEGDDMKPRLNDLQNDGEELINIDTGKKIADCDREIRAANAYLGAWGIKEALDQGADVVIAPRCTDAALTIGPAAWKFNWARDDYDALAGALLAGHIIECGPQATGGNYSFFKEVPSFKNIGYPIAEMEADGSFTITKHPGTGGIVNIGTVTEQILYEINSPAYINPDVVGHLDTMTMVDEGNDRVRVTGCRGSSPTGKHKVCINTFGGYKGVINLPLSGLDVKEKAKILADTWFDFAGGRDQFDEVVEELIHSGHANPQSHEESFATLRIVVKSSDRSKVELNFGASELNLTLSNIPGMVPTGTKTDPFMVHWPTLISSKHVRERVHFGGEVTEVTPTSELGLEDRFYQKVPVDLPPAPSGSIKQIPLGRVFGTRSGDKGGCANLGVWARTDEAYAYLQDYLTVEKFKELLPDTAGFEVERYEMPNIRSLNFFVKGFLGEGIAATSRIDGMTKSFGQYLACKHIDVPEVLIDSIAA